MSYDCHYLLRFADYMTATELEIAVADHDLNATNIDLVGLAQTGVEYNVYG